MCGWLQRGVLLIVLLMTSASAMAGDLTGCWEGSWQSCKSGHKGVLRAQFQKQSETSYVVHFTGRFFKIFPFKYDVTLNVVEEGADHVRLQGSSYLGRLFGTFCYEATVANCEFNANYTSKKDNGWFRMTKTSP